MKHELEMPQILTVEQQIGDVEGPSAELLSKLFIQERNKSRQSAIVTSAYNVLGEDFLWGLILELNGLGGPLGSGYCGSTDRGPILCDLGSGRRYANDGNAYDTSTSQVLESIVESHLHIGENSISLIIKDRDQVLTNYHPDLVAPLDVWINERIVFDTFSEQEIREFLLGGSLDHWSDDDRDVTVLNIIEAGYGSWLDAFLRRLVLSTKGGHLPDPTTTNNVLATMLLEIDRTNSLGVTTDADSIYEIYNQWQPMWETTLEVIRTLHDDSN